VEQYYARRIPIKSLQPNRGFDYVFYMQKDRIEKMREKRRRNKNFYSRHLQSWIHGVCVISNRRKIQSRVKVADSRTRDENGRFISKKIKQEIKEEDQNNTESEDVLESKVNNAIDKVKKKK